jgi:hypothetical protein
MRQLIYGMLIAAGAVLAGHSIATAAPAQGMAIGAAVNADPVIEPAHCRRWVPHRHKGAKPHGFGFGCPKKASRPKRA